MGFIKQEVLFELAASQMWILCPSLPIAKSSTPVLRRLSAGGITSSWDFPSVIKIPILGIPTRDPDSGLKQFSKIYVNARPGREWWGKEWIRKTERQRDLEGRKTPCQTHWWYQWNPTPVRVFPPLYGKFLTASMTASLVEKLFRCHSILGSPLYWARPTNTHTHTLDITTHLLIFPLQS